MNETSIKASIAKNLRAARLEKDMTQVEVSKRAVTNVKYYAKLERGEAIPSLKMLGRVVVALKLKSSDVLPF